MMSRTMSLCLEREPGAGSAGYPDLRRNIHIKQPTRPRLQVSSDNPPGRFQFNLNNLIRSTTRKRYAFVRVHRTRAALHLYLKGVTRVLKCHSYLKASVGLSCEARLAGSIPKITPITSDTPKATRTDVTEMGT